MEADVRRIPADWTPGGLAAEAFEIRWREGAAGAVADERFRELAFRALRGPWRAFRGARVSRDDFDGALDRVSPLLSHLEPVTIADYDADEHLPPLLDAFRAVSDVKPTRAKWVASSKTLYFLLPDLVPPIDNEFTGRFLRRSGVRLPQGIDEASLRAAFEVFSRLARLAGPRRLLRLSRSFTPPIGMARVVDFAIVVREKSVERAD